MALSLGQTIGVLQQSMSQKELTVWQLYREKYGPLNPIRMYDQAGAIIASQINNAHGGKAKPIDFMVYAPKPPEPDVEQQIQLMLADPNIRKMR